MTMSRNEHPARGAGRLIAALALPVLFGLGCAATADETSGDDHETPQTPENPPPVRLLAGAQPDGVLIYESWVVDGELRTREPAAIPADLVVVPWRRGEQLTFEVGSGQEPGWVDVLVFDRLPADRVPDAEPEHIECLSSEAEPRCQVDERPGDSLSVTVQASLPSEIVILNIGWLRQDGSTDRDPNLPPHVSASWAFAVESNP
jgi:hypothetical protein